MSTYRQLIFMVLDKLKLGSDDSFFNEEHVLFLLGTYRGLLLKQNYKDVKKEIPESNYQTICLDLIQVPAIAGEPCEGGVYLRSRDKIPNLISIATPRIYPEDYYQGNITYVSRERMRYVGNNKWLQNIIYASLGPDNYLYFKSYNPQYLYLEKVRLTGIFESPEKAAELSCDKDNAICDIMDTEFPIEEALISQLIESIVKDLSTFIYKPEDSQNNSTDDLSELASFIKQNLKSRSQKKLEYD